MAYDRFCRKWTKYFPTRSRYRVIFLYRNTSSRREKGQDVFYLVRFFDGADRSRYFKAVREVADKIELSIICDIADIDNFAIGVQRLHWQVGRELDPCVMADLAGVVVTLGKFPKFPRAQAGKIDALYGIFKGCGRFVVRGLFKIRGGHGFGVSGIFFEEKLLADLKE